jgi:copper chaperone
VENAVENTVINVDGMSCGGCVKNVTGALQAVSGVAQVEVSLEEKRASIEFDPSQTTRDALMAAIEDAGFDAS